MNQNTVVLVQESWKKVAAIAPQAAELFYQNLFAADPSLKVLFKGDMTEQGKKLMQMIKVIRAFRNHRILGDTHGYWENKPFQLCGQLFAGPEVCVLRFFQGLQDRPRLR